MADKSLISVVTWTAGQARMNDEHQIILRFPLQKSAKESQCLLASKHYTFTFLLPPDTLTPLSNPHHEL